MKIAIIADLHDNSANLERFLVLAKKMEIGGIVFCGDVTTPETLEQLVSQFAGPVKLACGNAEIRPEGFEELVVKYKNLKVFSGVGKWETFGLKVAFVHRPDRAEDLAKIGRYHFVFHGHTHQPWFGQIGETIIANPGTLGGVFAEPTFAVLDTETGRLELVRLWGTSAKA